MANADIELLFGVAGGGSVSGDSGALIQKQLNEIVSEINRNPLNIKFQPDKVSVESFKKQLKEIVDSVGGDNKIQLGALDFSKLSTSVGTDIHKISEDIDRLSTSLSGISRILGANGEIVDDTTGNAIDRVSELNSRLNELKDLLSQINSKNFSIQNVFEYKKGNKTTEDELQLYRDQATELLNLVNNLNNAMADVSAANGRAFARALSSSGEMNRLFELADKFKGVDEYMGQIAGSTTTSSLVKIIAALGEYRRVYQEVLDTVAKSGIDINMPSTERYDAAVNKLAEYNQRSKDLEKNFVDAANAAAGVSSAINDQNAERALTEKAKNVSELKDLMNDLLTDLQTRFQSVFDLTKISEDVSPVKSLVDKISAEFDVLRTKIVGTFDLSGIEMNIPNIGGTGTSQPPSGSSWSKRRSKKGSNKQPSSGTNDIVPGIDDAAEGMRQINDVVHDVVAGGIKPLQSGLDDVAEKFDSVGLTGNDVVTKITDALKKANVELSTATVRLSGTSKGMQEMQSFVVSGKDALGNAVKYLVTYDTKTGKVASDQLQLQLNLKATGEAAKKNAKDTEQLTGAMRELQVTASALKSEYSSLYKESGSFSADNKADFKKLQASYAEFLEANDKITSSSNDDAINKVRDLSDATQTLISTIKGRISAEKELANAQKTGSGSSAEKAKVSTETKAKADELLRIQSAINSSYTSLQTDTENASESRIHQLSTLKTSYIDLMTTIERMNEQIKAGNENDVGGTMGEVSQKQAAILETISALEKMVDAENNAAKAEERRETLLRSANNLLSSMVTKQTTWTAVTPEEKETLSKYSDELKKLIVGFQNGKVSAVDFENETKRLNSQFAEYSRVVIEGRRNTKEITSDTKEYQDVMKQLERSIGTAQNILRNASAGRDSGNYKAIERELQVLQSLKKEAETTGRISGDFDVRLKKTNATIVENANALKQAGLMHKSFGESVKEALSRFSQWFSVTRIVMAAYRTLKQMVSAVVDLDTAMTELKKVTDETARTYEQFLTDAAVRAKELGATVADTVTATADFARLGYSLSEASSLADAAIVYKNVGDGIENISDASESVISTMKAFGIEAKDAMSIVDKFNEVGRILPNGIVICRKKVAISVKSQWWSRPSKDLVLV